MILGLLWLVELHGRAERAIREFKGAAVSLHVVYAPSTQPSFSACLPLNVQTPAERLTFPAQMAKWFRKSSR